MARQKRLIRQARQTKIVLVAYLILALLVAPAHVTQAQAGVTTITPYVIVRDQAIVDNHVTVAQAFAPQSGWLVIYRDVAHDVERNRLEVIGIAAVRKGLNTNIIIPLDETPTGVTLYVLLHADEGELGVYEFPGSDAPIIVSNPPMIPFRVFGLTTLAGTAAQPEPRKTSAAVLRIKLRLLLGEHVLLVASTTDALLRGRDRELEAGRAALDENSAKIAAALGTVYDNATRVALLSLWRTHVNLLLDYATGLAANDSVKQDTAVTSQEKSVNDIAALLAAAKLNLAHDTIASLLHMQVKMLKAVIDAQAKVTAQLSGDQLVAYPALRTAYARTEADAALFATGISTQFSNIFQEDANSEAASLHSRLNGLLAEHVFLLAKSNAAALESRNIEYEAAFAALDQNSQELAGIMRMTYNDEVATTFLSLWRKNIGLYIDYNLAQFTQNSATQEKIMANLRLVATELAMSLSSINPKLDGQVLTALLVNQVQKMAIVIDAATVSNPHEFYYQLHNSYEYTQPLADALATAIVAQFPTRFPADIGSLNRLKNR